MCRRALKITVKVVVAAAPAAARVAPAGKAKRKEERRNHQIPVSLARAMRLVNEELIAGRRIMKTLKANSEAPPRTPNDCI